jgi:putative Ca2+/H+ antiporter (TMEM165/GDT1 family)
LPARESMDPVVLASSYSLLFVAEMGDKSQLIAMTLACRFRAQPVILGVLGAFLVLNLLAVGLGQALLQWVPERAVLALAGGLFLFFAYRSWSEAEAEADDSDSDPALVRGALLVSFFAIFLAELGDKTQLAMIGLAAATGAPGSVLVGGTLALWTVSLIGILAGGVLLRRIDPLWMHRGAALLFLLFGLTALYHAALGRGSVAAMVGL